jgi:flagellar basal body-associated protein FliL
MGVFAFYIETSNQESAVELKDRDGEARDVISRTLEQMSAEGLSSVDGKEKLKIVIRKNLNSILTRGQVRRVFIKNIVLKP